MFTTNPATTAYATKWRRTDLESTSEDEIFHDGIRRPTIGLARIASSPCRQVYSTIPIQEATQMDQVQVGRTEPQRSGSRKPIVRHDATTSDLQQKQRTQQMTTQAPPPTAAATVSKQYIIAAPIGSSNIKLTATNEKGQT